MSARPLRRGKPFAAEMARIESRFETTDTRLGALEEEVAEVNLKLTALIAALNQTTAVEAALQGNLIDDAQAPGSAPAEAR